MFNVIQILKLLCNMKAVGSEPAFAYYYCC